MAAAIFLVLLLQAQLPLSQPFQARVVSIADGDTLTVLHQRRQIRIRLHGIDCPEPGQPFHRRAAQRTAQLAFGQTVTILPQSRDRYGRLVASVLLPDGRSLSQILVAEGLAWHYRQYAPNDTTLARLEQSARSARRGLWQDPAPVPPWQWRKVRRGARQWSLP
ncbi:MAG: thermonuclease family protein [Bryobacteraceae bacterium]